MDEEEWVQAAPEEPKFSTLQRLFALWNLNLQIVLAPGDEAAREIEELAEETPTSPFGEELSAWG